MSIPVLQMTIRSERDAISSRKLAQHIADLASLSGQGKTKLATAVSEIARNALKYADGGLLTCSIIQDGRDQLVEFVITDEGPGIEQLSEIMEGTYSSRTGMGLGIYGSRKLLDKFHVENTNPGVRVRMAMRLSGQNKISERNVEEWKKVLATDQESSVELFAQQDANVGRTMRVLKMKERELEQQLQDAERKNIELKAAQDTLKEQATIDPLTGLLNRRCIMQTLDVEMNRAKRSGRSLSVAIADLDHFKNLNDTYGHVMGDAVLVEAARRMEGMIRPYDSVGRYGGEEFLFIFPNCSEEDSLPVCERVRSAMADDPMKLEEMTIEVSASFGLSSAISAESPKQAVDLADAALYRAKEQGRNRVEISTREDVKKLQDARTSTPVKSNS